MVVCYDNMEVDVCIYSLDIMGRGGIEVYSKNGVWHCHVLQ